MKKNKEKNKAEQILEENMPEPKFGWGWRIIYILLGISAIIYIIAVISPRFADFFNRYIASFVRGTLAIFSNLLPFSLGEVLLILLIPAIIFAVIVAVKRHCDSWKHVLYFSGKLFSSVAIMMILFVFTLGTGYHGSPLDHKLGLEKNNVTKEELRETADILTEIVNDLADDIEFEHESFSVMPYSRAVMNDKLMDAYDKARLKYDFIPKMYSRVKPVMMSELMSYTHITGIYSYFTGEANINIVFPDYTIPFTAAHELAHQRGIAKEDEANFVAFLVCIESDDPYIRYSAYASVLEYVTNAYYTADKSKDHTDYIELIRSLDIKVRYERHAYSEFFKKYKDNIAADISGATNDIYLQSQGVSEGSVSYGMVVDLAVAYYKSLRKVPG